MPLAMSSASLALNAALQANFQSHVPHNLQHAGLATQIGHSTSLNDSLSTINQSISNMNSLMPQNQAPSGEQLMQVHDLKREMRKKEQEFQKQNALLK